MFKCFICSVSRVKFNFHLFSALIKAIGKPKEPALLILFDIYQRTKAATEEEIIQTMIPDEIRYKLFDIFFEKCDEINIHYMSDYM